MRISRNNQKESHNTLRKAGRSLSFSKQQEIINSAVETIGVTMIEPEEESIKELALEIDRNRVALREYKKKVKQIMEDNGQSAGLREMSKAVGHMTTAILWVALGDPGS